MSAADMATVTASTKRPPAVSGGKVGAPATHLASLAVVPLLPLTPEIANTVQLSSPRSARVTWAFADSNNALPDVEEGDVLTVASVDYVVRSVSEWQRPFEGAYLELVVELVEAA